MFLKICQTLHYKEVSFFDLIVLVIPMTNFCLFLYIADIYRLLNTFTFLCQGMLPVM